MRTRSKFGFDSTILGLVVILAKSSGEIKQLNASIVLQYARPEFPNAKLPAVMVLGRDNWTYFFPISLGVMV